jgi:four helix bundle protein
VDRTLQTLRIYTISAALSDEVWGIVNQWDYLAKKTIGAQWADAADSIAANIAEGYGRFHFGERLRFLWFARGSLFETAHWLERAQARALITQAIYEKLKCEIDNLQPQLNAYINRTRKEQANGKKGQATSNKDTT